MTVNAKLSCRPRARRLWPAGGGQAGPGLSSGGKLLAASAEEAAEEASDGSDAPLLQQRLCSKATRGPPLVPCLGLPRSASLSRVPLVPRPRGHTGPVPLCTCAVVGPMCVACSIVTHAACDALEHGRRWWHHFATPVLRRAPGHHQNDAPIGQRRLCERCAGASPWCRRRRSCPAWREVERPCHGPLVRAAARKAARSFR